MAVPATAESTVLGVVSAQLPVAGLDGKMLELLTLGAFASASRADVVGFAGCLSHQMTEWMAVNPNQVSLQMAASEVVVLATSVAKAAVGTAAEIAVIVAAVGVAYSASAAAVVAAVRPSLMASSAGSPRPRLNQPLQGVPVPQLLPLLETGMLELAPAFAVLASVERPSS